MNGLRSSYYTGVGYTSNMRLPAVSVLVLWVLGVVGVTDAFSWPEWGRCPSVSVQQRFDVLSYLGTWYQQAGYNTELVQGDVRCVRADYLPSEGGKSGEIIVENRAISQRTNKTVSINGTAVQTEPGKNEGKLTVTFYFWKYFPIRGDYWVLGTDYETYSLVYSCHNLLLWHYKTLWALSRSKTFDTHEDKDAYYEQIVKTLWSHNVSVSLTEYDQTNCDA